MNHLRFALLLLLSASAFAAEPPKFNVLFIASDDLRPDLGCYGVKEMHSPNIDALAARGMLFERAYCQQATCSPSRTSLLLGRRPDTTRVWDLTTHFRKNLPDVVTLPQHFKANGYFTQSFGKIYHGGLDDAPSWSAPSMPGGGSNLPMKARGLFPGGADHSQSSPAKGAADKGSADEDASAKGGPKDSWAALDLPDGALPDGRIASDAIAVLKENKDRPFFLAVGFKKPHLPFVAPRKYFDLYPPESIKLAANPKLPAGLPDWVLENQGEVRAYTDIPNGVAPFSDEKARELIRAYHAAISYMDAQLGRVLAELDRLGLREKTIIVFWGDHGWHLGENGQWGKHTDFERATHAPLIVSVPGMAPGRTRGLVEFIDIYPTLCELAGLPLTAGLEGKSFAPQLRNPSAPGRDAAFSQWPKVKPLGRGGMGYTMRTDRYRYTEWRAPGQEPQLRELYDHETDPQENVNLAGHSEHRELLAKLAAQMRAKIPAR